MKRIEEVTLLYDISQALNEHLDLKKSLYKVLDILRDRPTVPQMQKMHPYRYAE